MLSEPNDGDDATLRSIVNDLRKPIHTLDVLKALLQSSLKTLQIQTSSGKKVHNGAQRFPVSEVRYILPLQDVIIQQIIPTWYHLLVEDGSTELVDLLLDPPSNSEHSSALVAVHAHTVLVSALQSSSDFAVNLLERLVVDWPLDKIHLDLFPDRNDISDGQLESIWSDYLRAVFAIPAKVANATKNNAPERLTFSAFFTRTLERAEILIEEWARMDPKQSAIDSLVQLVLKLVNTGFFPSTSSPNQPSFFQTNLSSIQKQLRPSKTQEPAEDATYSRLWSSILSSLPSPVAHKIAGSLMGCLEWNEGLSYSPSVQRKVSKHVRLLRGILGRFDTDRQESWDLVSTVVIERSWPEEVAMTLPQWAEGGSSSESQRQKALEELLKRTLELWTSSQHVKFSLLSRHHYVTALLLFTCSLLPPTSPALKALLANQKFMSAIGLYIGHTDPSIRHCGMLAAEYIAQRLGQKLKFEGWDEPGQGREWCRQLRKILEDGFVASRDFDEEEDAEADVSTPNPQPAPPTPPATDKPLPVEQPTLYDSDDSLTGYAQDSPASSRSASPTPSELEEIEKEPGLAIGRRKIAKPVYLVQLAQMLVSGKGEGQDEKSEPDRVEMALNEGAGLIRRKRGFGLELDENAVNLSIAFLNLRDNYDLDGFVDKRQEILNALVACCPTRSAPCLVEQFFIGEHSADVRSAILTALVVGARELAGLEGPSAPQRFASRMLPPALHRRYITSADSDPTAPSTIHRIAAGVTRQAIDRTRDANEVKVPQIMREKQLRVRQRPMGRGIVDLDRQSEGGSIPQPSVFKDVAAEFFIMPLINRFWVHIRDEQAREARSRYTSSAYRGDGSGMILSPAILSQFLLTLAILLHAGRHSPAYLSVLAPEAVELAVTMGTRSASSASPGEEEGGDGKSGTKANVLASALELTLEALDGSWELDQGRTIGLDYTRTVLAVREWAQKVLGAFERGLLVDEGGGEGENRARRASAGVLLVVEEIVTKWTAAMIRF
ncbi:telomere binding protein [Tulasnella sp. 424]|nr:telomere binding protein [Tulasnella sp. 424]KAG8968343.1 telomere binding protein [Tulasnella sp. 425]